MNTGNENSKKHYRQINIIYVVLFLGTVILYGTSVFIKITSNLKFFSHNDEIYLIFKILLGVFIIILLPLSYYIHKRKIRKLDKTLDLSQKLAYFKTSLVIKLSLIEYLCFFNLVTFFFFGDYYLLIPVSILLLILLINRPTIAYITKELNLSNEEKENLL